MPYNQIYDNSNNRSPISAQTHLFYDSLCFSQLSAVYENMFSNSRPDVSD